MVGTVIRQRNFPSPKGVDPRLSVHMTGIRAHFARSSGFSREAGNLSFYRKLGRLLQHCTKQHCTKHNVAVLISSHIVISGLCLAHVFPL